MKEPKARNFGTGLSSNRSLQVAVVIPCYRVTAHILDVLSNIGPEVNRIFVVDDACPEGTGNWVEHRCPDSRVTVVRCPINLGVGGATMTGYRHALEGGADIIVKIDGDGQLDPRLLPSFIAPLIRGEADYTKGNRFFNPEDLAGMPPVRILGNTILAFVTKISSGYWDVFDPTNGYTAIHRTALEHLPLDKISKRYFFETDMLFRLNTLRAVVLDIPMKAVYGSEVSNLRIRRVLGDFLLGNIRNTVKRIFYNYYLRSMSVASIELPLALLLLTFGVFFGARAWLVSSHSGEQASAGTVMLASLPIIVGVQLFLAFIAYDISAIPTYPRQRLKGNIE